MKELVAQACRDYCPATRQRAVGARGGFGRGGKVTESSRGQREGSQTIKDFQNFADPKSEGKVPKNENCWSGSEKNVCFNLGNG